MGGCECSSALTTAVVHPSVISTWRMKSGWAERWVSWMGEFMTECK